MKELSDTRTDDQRRNDQYWDNNDSFWDNNWYCNNKDCDTFVPVGETCPHCDAKDYNDQAQFEEQQRQIEVEQNHDYDNGDYV